MNGQLYQLCSIAAAGKRALQSGASIQYTPAKYENKITFSFCPQEHTGSVNAYTGDAKKHTWTAEQHAWHAEEYTAPNVEAWFDQLLSMGLQDIKVLCPVAVKDRGLLGFSNATGSSILCFYKSGKVTYYVADWQFDSMQSLWNIHYTEQEWKNPPAGKPHFKNNTDSFRQILLNISAFAVKIESENFARIFDSARSILDGNDDYPDQKYGLPLPQIPCKNLRLFEAASLADVFGAMGSWNDSPACAAHEKRLDQEYERLSDELLRNIRLAILYAINEW